MQNTNFKGLITTDIYKISYTAKHFTYRLGKDHYFFKEVGGGARGGSVGNFQTNKYLYSRKKIRQRRVKKRGRGGAVGRKSNK